MTRDNGRSIPMDRIVDIKAQRAISVRSEVKFFESFNG